MQATHGVGAHPDVGDQVAFCLKAILALARTLIAGHVCNHCRQLIHGPARHADAGAVTLVLVCNGRSDVLLTCRVALCLQGSLAGMR